MVVNVAKWVFSLHGSVKGRDGLITQCAMVVLRLRFNNIFYKDTKRILSKLFDKFVQQYMYIILTIKSSFYYEIIREITSIIIIV